MRLVVDVDRCDGTGVCAAIAPELLELADDDVVRVLRADLTGREAAAEEAARACPKLALTVVDGH